MKYGRGRRPFQADERDWPVAKLKAMIERGEAVPVVWSDTEILDQNGSPACVAFGTGGMLNCDDEQHIDPHLTNDQCHVFYGDIKALEGDNDPGAYVRDGLKVAKAKGWVSGYALLSSVAEIDDWLKVHGPVLIGTVWTDAMCHPLGDVVVVDSTDTDEGHCWFENGLDGVYYRAVNSWGEGWADGGKFRLARSDFWKLLNAGGEAWAAVQPAPGPVPPTPDPEPPVPSPTWQSVLIEFCERLVDMLCGFIGWLKGE